jgi:hypothetical protein
MDHNCVTEVNPFPLLLLPNDIITVIVEKFDNINNILNFDITCRKIHNIIDSPTFWKQLVDIWFGPSQLLIDNFGRKSYTIIYQTQLIHKSGLFDPKVEMQLFHKHQFKQKMKIKFMFHCYYLSLHDAIRRCILNACKTKRSEEYKAYPIPYKPPITLEKINFWSEQFGARKFRFAAFNTEWSGFAMLYTNGEWIITTVAMTIRQIDDIYNNFARYIKGGGLAEVVVPNDKMDDIDLYTNNFVRTNTICCLWPFQLGPNNVQSIHPNLVFVFYGINHYYLFQIYSLTTQEKERVFHIEDNEWRSINL